MSAIRTFVAKHPAPVYFALTFAISWGGALWGIGGSGAMRGTAPGSDPRFVYALVAMLAGPTLTSLLLTAFLHGRTGLRALLSRLLAWRVGAQWYAVAIVTAPLLMTATLLALSIASPAFLPGIFTADQKGPILLAGLAVGLSAGIFEEPGWTGFATPTMRRRDGMFRTGLILGICWSAWHLFPNVWSARVAAGELDLSVYFTTTALGIFVGYLTAFRILMVWVYEHTASLLVGMLMHVSITTSLLILNPIGLSGLNLVIYSFALAAAVWTVVALVALVNRGQHQSQPVRQRAA
jgi:CAAX protease family protein